MSNTSRVGIATPKQADTILAQWARLYGSDNQDGPRELHGYTGRTDPRRILKSEAELYLALLATKKPGTRPVLTEEQMAAKVARF
jgi:hypothetical protein